MHRLSHRSPAVRWAADHPRSHCRAARSPDTPPTGARRPLRRCRHVRPRPCPFRRRHLLGPWRPRRPFPRGHRQTSLARAPCRQRYRGRGRCYRNHRHLSHRIQCRRGHRQRARHGHRHRSQRLRWIRHQFRSRPALRRNHRHKSRRRDQCRFGSQAARSHRYRRRGCSGCSRQVRCGWDNQGSRVSPVAHNHHRTGQSARRRIAHHQASPNVRRRQRNRGHRHLGGRSGWSPRLGSRDSLGCR